jgi:hypothetical protein
MLPDFPKIRHELSQRLRLRTYLKTQQNTPIKELGATITQHEGELHSYEQLTHTGTRTVTEGLEEISVPIEIRIDEIPQLVGDELLARVDSIAEEAAGQASRITFRKMDQTTREAGNAFDAGGGPPTKELWLKIFDGMEIDFDPVSNRPEITFIAHPVMAEAMRKLWKDWELDTGFVQRYEDLLARKRDEWRDREGRRKLVD